MAAEPQVTEATGATGATGGSREANGPELDQVLLAVLANRFESIVREMTNTLFRTGRSAVLNMARDFSCSIVTADDQLLAAAEGLRVTSSAPGCRPASMLGAPRRHR
ncbi:MAG: hydantoinase B/oxoprolinase family protein [Solirubrobacterales bacterium]